MVGIPGFAGFTSKLLFAQAAVENDRKMLITLIALALSTILNAIYFMKTVVRIFTPEWRAGITPKQTQKVTVKDQPAKSVALVCFIILNLILGLYSEPILQLLERGLQMFA